VRSARVGTSVLAGLAVVTLTLAACGSNSDNAGSSAGSTATSAASATTSAASSAMSEAASAGSSAASEASSAGSSASSEATGSSGGGGGDPKTATSMADFGGMDGLVAAAKAEGKLNVIALPPDWANYGEVIKAFQAKYPDIEIDQQQPNASSADEITAAKTNAGTDAAPDVFDLGTSVTLANTNVFAPYKVAAWDDIADVSKESTGLWVNDYTGIMAVGYDASTYGDVTSLDQLLDPKFKGVVALNGNPTEAGTAFNGVVMAALANGGSLDDISKGVEYFQKLKDAGNLFTGDATPATVQSGETGVLFDWTYNQVGYAAKLKAQGADWKYFVPEGAALGSYYNQAINADAPHPAAARLWEEFLYSPDAQNLWLKGAANPVLQESMVKAGTIDQAALDALPTKETPQVQTADQIKASGEYLTANWPKVGG
jgi:putative spermidine/putrescine transport system substrate-binding protein